MVALALMNAAAGDDDDGIAWWDKIPAYEKERNIIIVIPPYMKNVGTAIPDSTGRYLKFPLPYGWNVPLYGATLSVDAARNAANPAEGIPASKASIDLMTSAFKAFSPVNGLPPNVDPFYRHFANKNSFGEGQLYPENKFSEHKPDSEKYSSSMKGGGWQEWASFVNEATGGNQFKEGLVSLPPAVWRNYIKAFIGGPASFATGSYDAYSEDDITKAPFVRKAFGEVSARHDQTKFYTIANEAIKAEKAYNDARKSDLPTAEAMYQSDKVLIQIGGQAERVQKRLGEIYKNDSLVKDSKTLTDEEKKLKLKINERRRSDIEEEFLKSWREKVSVK